MISRFLRVFREHRVPNERSRKGAEIIELRQESTRAVLRADRAIRERERLAASVRNTVRAVRREPLT